MRRPWATTHYPDAGLTVWDVDRGVVSFNDPGRVSGSAAWFSPDGRRFALAHEDGEILLDDPTTGQLLRRWPGPGGIKDLAFRPDGAAIAVTATEDPEGHRMASCWIFDAEAGRPIRSIPLPGPCDVAWSPDGTTLATPCDDARIDLWDAATGLRKAVLVDHVNGGPGVAFHPAGTLLAGLDRWKGLRLWDPALGRLALTMDGTNRPQFSRDGRIIVALRDRLTTYRVEPALEYRTFALGSAGPDQFLRASIRRDGRVLAVGTSRGVTLWDLARCTEIEFLRIGSAMHLLFEESGDLLTGGRAGVQRWPIRLDLDRGDLRIGPPRPLRALPEGHRGIAEDASGRVVALADRGAAYVQTPERAFRLRPLEGPRSVAVSPDGRWLVTGGQGREGADVWRVSDGARVAHLPIEGTVELLFSPDGRWLMVQHGPGRLWDAGTWREVRRLDGDGLAFSPDGRLVAVQDARKVLRLVEAETGRTLARLEGPDRFDARWAAFSPDGSRLVVTTSDGPAVHVWDLRAIRRRLADLGLDWDAPAYPVDEPWGPAAPPLPRPRVDFGGLIEHLPHHNEDPAILVERHSARLRDAPDDVDALHHRAHALSDLGRYADAIDDLGRAILLRPGDAHFRSMRGMNHRHLNEFEPAIVDLEAALALQADSPLERGWLADCCNNRAWELANGPQPRHALDRALALSRRAVALLPGDAGSLNTLGVIHYRAGRHDEAIAALERSMAAESGRSDGFNLFSLAMAHHRLGHREAARACFDRGLRWLGGQPGLRVRATNELAAFRAEAESVLAGPAGELPDDVFAHDADATRSDPR